MKNNKKIGFIGQGWVGKNYADNFEERGYNVVRYGLEKPYCDKKDQIKECDIVFIAVPTPTTPEGFNNEILRKAIKLVGENKIAVIKSTLLPGTTERIQEENFDVFVFHSPEFLTEATAAYDAANPNRNIIGMPIDNDEYQEKAKLILSVLPKAPFELVTNAKEAEFIKYGGNNWFYVKVVFINMLYDLAVKNNCKWEVIRDGLAGDPRIGSSHLNPVHKSGTSGGEAKRKLPFYELHLEPIHKTGRGAGGHCFIKDFVAFKEMYEKEIGDKFGVDFLKAMENKNIDLLLKSKKDLDLLAGVYGEEIIKNLKNNN